MSTIPSSFDTAYRVAAVCLSFLFVSCGDAVAPGGIEMAAKQKTEVHSTPTTTQATQPKIVEVMAEAPPLETTQKAFWAIQGTRTCVRVNYLAPDLEHPEEGDLQKFLVLVVPRTTQLIDPNGNRLADGDSLLITLTLDSNDLAVEFEPHGLVFDVAPAQLELWYVYADLSEDEEGNQPSVTDLSIWYQAAKNDPWIRLPTTLSRRGEALDADLNHFSNYAIAW